MKKKLKSSKKSSKLQVVFFGSGPVAAESLRLLAENFDIEAVVTKPTTKREMLTAFNTESIYTVSDKNGLDDLFATKKFKSTVAVLIDFGIIVSNKVIDYFPKGIVNSHFSLLPELRGADPISFAILEGKDKTGVSLMLLVEAMDEGPIIAIGEQQLDGTETGPSLTHSLIQLSNSLLQETLPLYVLEHALGSTSTTIEPQPQDAHCASLNKQFHPTYTRKLTKQDGILDYAKPVQQLEREIRAFVEWPKSRTSLGGIDCIITEAQVLPSAIAKNPGTPFLTDSGELAITCKEGALIIRKLKPSGKKEMDAASFLAGYKDRVFAA